jgi:hypothetical protein
MPVPTAAWAAFLAFTISTNSCKEKEKQNYFMFLPGIQG